MTVVKSSSRLQNDDRRLIDGGENCINSCITEIGRRLIIHRNEIVEVPTIVFPREISFLSKA